MNDFFCLGASCAPSHKVERVIDGVSPQGGAKVLGPHASHRGHHFDHLDGRGVRRTG